MDDLEIMELLEKVRADFTEEQKAKLVTTLLIHVFEEDYERSVRFLYDQHKKYNSIN